MTIIWWSACCAWLWILNYIWYLPLMMMRMWETMLIIEEAGQMRVSQEACLNMFWWQSNDVPSSWADQWKTSSHLIIHVTDDTADGEFIIWQQAGQHCQHSSLISHFLDEDHEETFCLFFSTFLSETNNKNTKHNHVKTISYSVLQASSQLWFASAFKVKLNPNYSFWRIIWWYIMRILG